MAWVATGVAVVGGIAKFIGSKKAAKKEAARKRKLQRKLASLEANRQAVINPYSGASNLSGLAKDLSSQMTNPYNNLAVATQAMEIQQQETDLALATTLDTLRATGSGAGGATALAQQAAASKKQITADIEGQEAANEKQRAQGEATLQAETMSEKKRLQTTQISEAQRMQGLDAAGKQFVWQQNESRETTQMDRVSSQLDQAQAAQAQAQADATSALTGTVSAVGGMAAQGAYKGAFTKKPTKP
tara:strand:+ start:31 stop:765 length:735 start_codon:yes stop_codon:yes gene_type:complete